MTDQASSNRVLTPRAPRGALWDAHLHLLRLEKAVTQGRHPALDMQVCPICIAAQALRDADDVIMAAREEFGS